MYFKWCELSAYLFKRKETFVGQNYRTDCVNSHSLRNLAVLDKMEILKLSHEKAFSPCEFFHLSEVRRAF
jgi:hypothetical protein